MDEITERIEFFAQSKLKEIEGSYQKKLIDQLYRRINNLENLCHAQNLQLNNACKEIDSLKEGTTDILKRYSLNTESLESNMVDIEHGCFDGNFLSDLFDEVSTPPLKKRKKMSETKTPETPETLNAKKYFSWEKRMKTLLNLSSLMWKGGDQHGCGKLEISRRDAESMFPHAQPGKSIFQFQRCYGKKGDNSRFEISSNKTTVAMKHRCLTKENILCLYGEK